MPLNQLLFGFRGRMRRSQWWAVRVVTTVILFVLIGVFAGLGGSVGRSQTAEVIAGGVALIVGLPVVTLYLWIFVATSVKRLHDQDLSGWFTLIYFIPYLGGLAAFVMLGCLEGTKGRNRFGASDKYPESTANVFA
ncbi:MAG TPA: DUF805 domain-containing protein [Caulobacteraceae bacterium]|jgi:uncharacterized membrane protein YhaH (DUF805 family)|nr:DUF805 domain-containing protein [Caulobacteraceae bacterium]